VKTKVVPATLELVKALEGRYRTADMVEVQAMSGRSVEDAVREGVQSSELCWVGLVDDTPEIVFGARRVCLLSNEGTPWLLGTARIKEVRKVFIESTAFYVKEMLKVFEYLENFVDVRNTASIKWLRACGFTIEPPEIVGVMKMPFNRFWLRR
jgi:hypothetical protein